MENLSWKVKTKKLFRPTKADDPAENEQK